MSAITRLAGFFEDTKTTLGMPYQKIVGELAGEFNQPTRKINFIFSAARAGFSANVIQSYLKTSPFGGMRRQNIQKVARSIKNIKAGHQYVMSLRPNKAPAIAGLLTGPYPLTNKYNYIIELRGVNKYDGTIMSQHITLTSNALIHKSNALQIVYDNMPEYDYEFEPDAMSAEVVDIYLGGKYL